MVSLETKDFLEGVKKYKSEERGFIYDWCREKAEKAKVSGRPNWHVAPDAVRAVLLIEFGWNYAAPETKGLKYPAVEKLLNEHSDGLLILDCMDLQDVDLGHYSAEIGNVYSGFKGLFGQTGAAKALSVLNPDLFMMWDTRIRKLVNADYGIDVANGEKTEHYIKFLGFSQQALKSLTTELDALDLEMAVRENIKPRVFHSLAKSLDEYFYATTKF